MKVVIDVLDYRNQPQPLNAEHVKGGASGWLLLSLTIAAGTIRSPDPGPAGKTCAARSVNHM